MNKSNHNGSDYIFDYDKAFSRNIGWVTELEQHLLKNKRIAIPGLSQVLDPTVLDFNLTSELIAIPTEHHFYKSHDLHAEK